MQQTLSDIINIICKKEGKWLVCGETKKISFSPQDQISSWQKWIYAGRGLNQKECCDDFPSRLFFFSEGRRDDRTGHMLLLCHMSHPFCLQEAGMQIHTVRLTAGEKSEAAVMLILSDGSICGIVASNQSVTNRLGWLLCHPTTVPNSCAPGRSARLQY